MNNMHSNHLEAKINTTDFYEVRIVIISIDPIKFYKFSWLLTQLIAMRVYNII